MPFSMAHACISLFWACLFHSVLLNFLILVLWANANCTTDNKVHHATLGRVVGDINVKVVGPLLRAALGQFTGGVERGTVYIIGRMGLHELRGMIGWS